MVRGLYYKDFCFRVVVCTTKVVHFSLGYIKMVIQAVKQFQIRDQQVQNHCLLTCQVTKKVTSS